MGDFTAYVPVQLAGEVAPGESVVEPKSQSSHFAGLGASRRFWDVTLLLQGAHKKPVVTGALGLQLGFSF